MKTIFFIILVMITASVSNAQTQKVYKVTDIIEGQTILQFAQKYDAEAFVQTRATYLLPGMNEANFVTELQKSFSAELVSVKPVFNLYFKYIYSLHVKGLSETQVINTTTGKELAGLFTGLYAFKTNNPDIFSQNPGSCMMMPKWLRDLIQMIFNPLDL